MSVLLEVERWRISVVHHDFAGPSRNIARHERRRTLRGPSRGITTPAIQNVGRDTGRRAVWILLAFLVELL